MVQPDNNDFYENERETLALLEALVLSGFASQPVTPTGQQIQLRDDQVRNNAGGFVFQVDDLSRVRRFLILGSAGGTYYVSEKELTIQNVEHLIKLIEKGKGGLILRELVEISLGGRAPKQEPLLLALALCARCNTQNWKHQWMKQWQKSGDKVENASTEFEKARARYMFELSRAAFLAVEKVCRIPTHLFTFVKFCEMVSISTSTALPATVAVSDSEPAVGSGEEEEGKGKKSNKGPTGWGRGMRKCIAEWYLTKTPMELAMHVTKYKSREGYSHRDLLRLAHPQASRNHAGKEWDEQARLTLVYDQIFHFACTGSFDEQKEVLPASVNEEADGPPPMKRDRCDYQVTPEMVGAAQGADALAFLRTTVEAQKLTADKPEDVARCVELIKQFGLVREHIPTELLNSDKVWEALLEKMPMTALIRNLSKLSSLGLITGEKKENDCWVEKVVGRLTDAQALHRARVHPISVLLASAVYNSGKGLRGKQAWKVNHRVSKALDKAFYAAFANVEPTGKRYCVALDVSGSMSSPISAGSALSCREAASALSAVFLRTEPKVEVMAFTGEFIELPFTSEWTVQRMVGHTDSLPFGSTDCSQPMLWAAEKKKEFDVFIVMTDNETWAGGVQPFVALRDYREKSGIRDAKLVVLAMTSSSFTIADPTDRGMLDIAGLDAAVPELIRTFVLGGL